MVTIVYSDRYHCYTCNSKETAWVYEWAFIESGVSFFCAACKKRITIGAAKAWTPFVSHE